MNRKSKRILAAMCILLAMCTVSCGSKDRTDNSIPTSDPIPTPDPSLVSQFNLTAEPEPTATPRATETATEPPVRKLSDNAMPDFQSFSGNRLKEHSKVVDNSFTKIVYFTDCNKKFVNEYMDLLQSKYKFKLRRSKQTSDIDIYDYWFDYKGNKNISTFEKNDEKNVAIHILAYYLGDDNYEIQISYADGLDYTDTGDRTSYSLSNKNENDVSGNSQDSESSNDYSSSDSGSSRSSSGTKVKCWKCHGDGEIPCTNCDGKGFKEKTVSAPNYDGKSAGNTQKTYRETCFKCKGTQKQPCPVCN